MQSRTQLSLLLLLLLLAGCHARSPMYVEVPDDSSAESHFVVHHYHYHGGDHGGHSHGHGSQEVVWETGDSDEQLPDLVDASSAKTMNFHGKVINYFESQGYYIVQPRYIISIPSSPSVRTWHSHRYTITIPIKIQYIDDLPSSGEHEWVKMKLSKLSAKVGGKCGSYCGKFTVIIIGDADSPQLQFRCKSKSACSDLSQELIDEPSSVFSILELIFVGSANGMEFGFKSKGSTGRPSGGDGGKYDRFEGGKLLLFTMRSEVGKQALSTWLHGREDHIPRNRKSFPSVYRSQLVDDLSRAVTRFHSRYMIAEMRVRNRVVARAVFDVSHIRHSINKQNWYTKARLVSTYPYSIKGQRFNFFSVKGHDAGGAALRTFFINNGYGGCNNDKGFLAVIDRRDVCKWAHWTGTAPVFMYNPSRGSTWIKTGRQADRFLIYLTDSIPGIGGGKMRPYKFEGGKWLLFTMRSEVGKQALSTWLHGREDHIPRDRRRLPSVYRSGLVDNLSHTVRSADKRYMVAEMRVRNRVVARAVFDVSYSSGSLNKQNWYTKARLVSTYPYSIKDQRFNFFSVKGHDAGGSALRTFFINNGYGGCNNDKGFMAVIDRRDVCKWAHWTGTAPVFMYNPSRGSTWIRTGRQADRFLIYLTDELP